jgi:predicted transcriptional regulator
MDQLNKLLQELGISKVRLAKYLGVSRQMVYNYLELENINKWPKEKKILLLKLLDIEDGDDETISNIKVNTDYLLAVENRLTEGVKEAQENDYLDLKGLKKEEHALISDITFLIKEKLVESENHEENFYTLQYVYHMLQSIDNVPEIKYLLAYLSKATGFTAPNVFKFNEDKQFIFEGIIYTAFNLYNNGGASKNRVIESRNKFVQEIESRNEEKLSRTQQLFTVKVQALRELGYSELNTENAAEVFEKIAEIESRKV